MAWKCPKCGKNYIREEITGGIRMKVHWHGDFVIANETTLDETLEYSKFYCDSVDCSYEGEIDIEA